MTAKLPPPQWPSDGPYSPVDDAYSVYQMLSFAASAVAQERERCAKIAESIDDGTDDLRRGSDGRDIADAIRSQ